MAILETDRLMLQEWVFEDWELFRPIATNPEVMRYITGGRAWSDEEIGQFVARQIENSRRDGFCFWKLMEKTSGRPVGFCGLQRVAATGEVEIGWWLARDCWGRGLATEAARQVLAFAWSSLRLRRIVSFAHPENLPSIRIMQKLGMTFEKNTTTAEMGRSPAVPLVVYVIEH